MDAGKLYLCTATLAASTILMGNEHSSRLSNLLCFLIGLFSISTIVMITLKTDLPPQLSSIYLRSFLYPLISLNPARGFAKLRCGHVFNLGLKIKLSPQQSVIRHDSVSPQQSSILHDSVSPQECSSCHYWVLPQECSICHESVSISRKPPSAFTNLHCSHVFHEACIRREFNNKRKMMCPNCRYVEEDPWRRDEEEGSRRHYAEEGSRWNYEEEGDEEEWPLDEVEGDEEDVDRRIRT